MIGSGKELATIGRRKGRRKRKKAIIVLLREVEYYLRCRAHKIRNRFAANRLRSSYHVSAKKAANEKFYRTQFFRIVRLRKR
jgi:hypothetical protein